MNNELVSVIVPVYNIEEYLNRCIESIIAQTYSNLEILLIDDGSTDSSGRMCDQWAERDSRIRVVHKTNGGLSDARNTGIELAGGNYFAFVDSDDYISPDFIQVLYHALVTNNADMSICNVGVVNEDGNLILHLNERIPQINEVISGRDAVLRRFERNDLVHVAVWNKLYRKELFSTLRFPVGQLHEDDYVMHRLLGKCTRIACVPGGPYYFYVQRSLSLSRNDNMWKNFFHAERAALDQAVYLHTLDLPELSGRQYWKSFVMFLEGCQNCEKEQNFSAIREREREKPLISTWCRIPG